MLESLGAWRDLITLLLFGAAVGQGYYYAAVLKTRLDSNTEALDSTREWVRDESHKRQVLEMKVAVLESRVRRA